MHSYKSIRNVLFGCKKSDDAFQELKKNRKSFKLYLFFEKQAINIH